MYFSFLASSLTWPETRYRAGRSGRCSAGARILVLRVSNGRPSARYRGSFSGFMRRPACATSRRVQCVVLTFAVTRWAARWRGRAARWRIHGGDAYFLAVDVAEFRIYQRTAPVPLPRQRHRARS